VMLRLALAVACGFSESATSTVKVDLPVAVGVPESAPVLGLMESQDGLPLRLQV